MGANMNYPEDLDEELQDILGRPCFACGAFADLLRSDGQPIARKAEAEQASVLHWSLKLYLQHGPEWRKVANAELKRIRATIDQKKAGATDAS